MRDVSVRLQGMVYIITGKLGAFLTQSTLHNIAHSPIYTSAFFYGCVSL